MNDVIDLCNLQIEKTRSLRGSYWRSVYSVQCYHYDSVLVNFCCFTTFAIIFHSSADTLSSSFISPAMKLYSPPSNCTTCHIIIIIIIISSSSSSSTSVHSANINTMTLTLTVNQQQQHSSSTQQNTQTDRQTDRQRDTQTDRQTDRQTYTHNEPVIQLEQSLTK